MMHLFADIDPITQIVACVVIGILCVVVNFIGAKLAEYFGTMIFLDAIGTAIAAFTCGPGVGALVGLGTRTNLATGTLLFAGYLYFFYVNVLCGLTWGFLSNQVVAPSSNTKMILFILTAGGIVGVVSTLLSTPLRIFLEFKTDHLLDRVGLQTTANNPRRILRWIKIFSSEVLLSHLLDKTISTVVGIMVVLEIIKLRGANSGIHDPLLLYHDLIELLAAYYYVALAIVVKTLRVNVVDPAKASGQDQILVLLGPLGIFAMLLGFPVLVRVIAAIILSLAGVSLE